MHASALAGAGLTHALARYAFPVTPSVCLLCFFESHQTHSHVF